MEVIKEKENNEHPNYPFSKKEAIKLAPLIGLNAPTFKGKATKDYKKYAWFLRIVLSSKVPYGFKREMAPNKEIVYFNEATGEISSQHPQSKFFRKTFTKVVKGELEFEKCRDNCKIIVDKKSRKSINKR